MNQTHRRLLASQLRAFLNEQMSKKAEGQMKTLRIEYLRTIDAPYVISAYDEFRQRWTVSRTVMKKGFPPVDIEYKMPPEIRRVFEKLESMPWDKRTL